MESLSANKLDRLGLKTYGVSQKHISVAVALVEDGEVEDRLVGPTAGYDDGARSGVKLRDLSLGDREGRLIIVPSRSRATKTTKKKVGRNPSSTAQNYKLQLWMMITTQNLQ
jgi:hypothetical protein